MGMYADIDGVQVKYTGLLAYACESIGIKPEDDGFVEIKKEDLKSVAWVMYSKLRNPEYIKCIASTVDPCGTEHIEMQKMYCYMADVHVTILMLDYSSNPEAESLLFA